MDNYDVSMTLIKKRAQIAQQYSSMFFYGNDNNLLLSKNIPIKIRYYNKKKFSNEL